MNHAWITEFDLSGRRYAPAGVPMAGRPMDISNKMIKKWDHELCYIKRWLPELLNVPNKDLYNWDNDMQKKFNLHVAPIFNYKEKYNEWIELCK
jgi:hypothetical protein